MKKRILSLILAALTVFSLCSAAFASDGIPANEDAGAICTNVATGGGSALFDSAAQASAVLPRGDVPATAATSGTCGSSLTWSFNSSTGTLTISGSGQMYNYTSSNPPWSNLPVRSIMIERYVTSIGAGAFAGLDSFREISWYTNGSLRSIGTMAFFGSGSNTFSNFKVPHTVTTLAEGAFTGLPVTSFAVPSGSTAANYFSVSSGVLYNKTKTTLLQYPPISSSTSFSVPSTVSRIGDGALMLAVGLKSITLPSSLRTIGDLSFYSCSSLTSVSIPSGVTTIGVAAFAECDKLSSITVNNAKCTIKEDSSFSGKTLGVPRYTVVKAATGSTAQTYAKNHGYTFQSTGGGTVNPGKTGLYTEGGYTYYYKNGVKQKGIVTASNGKMYYCDSSYHVVKNKVVKVNGKFYACLSTGEIGTDGWIRVNGVIKYYAGSDGVLYTGYQTIGKNSYYFSVQDAHLMKGGLVTGPGGYQYYVSAKDGHAMKGGWARGKQVKGTSLWNYYYLDSTGVVILAVQSRTQPNYKPV